MALQFNKNVYDKFVLKGVEFVVINDKKSSNENLNQKLLLAYVDIIDHKKVILPIRDEELYNIALDYYITLKNSFFKEGE